MNIQTALSALLLIGTATAWAAPPRTNLTSAPLVTPANAWTYYGSGTTHTNGAGHTVIRPPEITALARGLGSERVGQPAPTGITADEYANRVYDYVRNNIEIEFQFGLSKGARGALIDQSGSAFDQVHLMIELLRQAGITAGYRVGTVSLTAQEFGQWTGLVKNLNPATQAFDVDAKTACQMLADGAIPATVSGQTSCASVTGNLASTGTPVVMGHVWVAANSKFYDPAYKKHYFKAGVDLPAAMGCGTEAAPTCGTGATTAAMTGSTSSTIGGSPAITNVRHGPMSNYVIDRALALQTHIEANLPTGRLIDLIGGKEIDHAFAPVPGPATLFPSVTQYSWAGEVPDQFRTTLRLRYAIFDLVLFADEISGKRLRVFGYPQGTTPGWLLYLESQQIVTPTCTTCSWVEVSLTVNHPYAANSGQYADQQVDMPLLASATPNVPPITIVHGFGKASPSTEQFYADLQVSDPNPVFAANGFPKPPGPGFDPICGGGTVWAGVYRELLELCRNDNQPTMVAKALAQGGLMDRIVEGMNRSVIQRHHTIGMVASQIIAPSMSDLLSIQSDVSVSSNAGDAVQRKATFESASIAWGMLEGSAAQQVSDTWMPDSATGLMFMANLNSIPFIDVAAANMSTVMPSLVGYSTDRQNRLLAAAADGYSAIVPRNATPGAFNLSGKVYTWLVGGGLFHKADSLGYMVNESYKGGIAGSGADSPDQAVLNSARAANYAVNSKKYLNVSPASGELALDPAPDIVTGAGSFPDALPLQRSYRSGSGAAETLTMMYGFTGTSFFQRRYWAYNGPDVNGGAHLGGAWMHNYRISASLGSNALKAMNPESALDATRFVAGLYILQDTLKNPTFQRRLTAIFTAHWLNDIFRHNSVVVDVGGKVEVFGLLPNGIYNPPPGSASNLLQFNTPIGPRPLNTADIIGYDYSPVTFVYTDRNGASLGFNWGTETYNDAGAYARSMFKPVSWSFPGGGWLTFAYYWNEVQWSGYESIYVAQVGLVTNHLGRSLSFTNNYRTVSANPYTWVWVASRVTDENARYIDYLPTGCPPLMNWPGEGSAASPLNCYTFTATTSDALTTGYTYGPAVDSPNPSWIVRPDYRLRRTFVPSNLSTPFQTIVYDDLFRAKSVKDALDRVTNYYTASVGMQENRVASEVIDATNAITRQLYDHRGSLLRSTDPIGRITTNTYDGAGRLIRAVSPEGNAVEQVYDVRSNVLSTTKKAKPGSGLADIVTSAIYGEAPLVKFCVNLRTCNQPSSTTDALGQVTNYSWDPLYGELTQLRLPADTAAVRPQTDYAYTLYGPAPQFRRLTTKTDKITSSLNLVSTYAYNASNKYVLQTAVVDSGGLNLTTGFTFDAVGNVTAVDGPRTDVTDVTNYAWDIHRRLKYEVGADPDGAGALLRPATQYTYDLDSQLTQTDRGTTTSATGVPFTALERSTHTYDAVGNKLRDTVMNGATTTPLAVTQYSYDAVDRLDCNAMRMNSAVFGSLPTSACTLSTAGSFGEDRITKSQYDLAGQLLKTIRAYGTSLQQDYATYTYTLNGQQATIKDARNNLSTQEYDGFDRLAKLRFPLPTAGANASSNIDYEQYGYDANGNRVRLRKRDGSVLEYRYDNLNRETLKEVPGGTANNVYSNYDLLGRKLYARFGSTGGNGVVYTYDKPGRLLTEATFGRTLSYQYDAAGNRTRITWPDALYVQYTYDALNRMLQARENGATSGAGLLATYSYDNLGRRTGLSRGNTVTTSWGYDGMSRLTSLVQNPAGTTHDLTVSYGYNPVSQLVSRSANNDTYVWPMPPVGSTAYGAANGLNQYPTVAGSAYSYDLNGNLTTGGAKTRTYDVENRLISITGSPNLGLEYDPLGRLRQLTAGTTPTQLLYSGDALVGEYNSAGTLTKRYVHGAGIDEPLTWYEGSGTTDRRWLLADERGSIIAHTTAAGAATPYSYGPYGEPNVWTGSRFRYTGQIALPEAQLYHYKARAYDSGIGRFLQTDPVGYMDDLNLYTYVGSDPLNNVDPTGAWLMILPFIPPAIETIVIVGSGASAACAATPACTSYTGDAAESLWGRLSQLVRSGVPMATMAPLATIGVMQATSRDDQDSERDEQTAASGRDDKKLSAGEIKKLKDAGYDPESLKGGKRTGRLDLFKDRKGNIKVKPKDGSGPGDPLGININDL